MPYLIKICGLSTSDTLAVSLEAGADIVGFVRFAKSPRHVSLKQAADLAAQSRGKAKSVILTVNADDHELDAIMRVVAPDMLQLHGNESVQRVKELSTRYRIPIIKAVGVSSPEDIDGVELYRDNADLILVDAKPPAGADLPGGNGVAFDWSLVQNISPTLPIMLSGGLTPETIAEAIEKTGVTAIDVSSGVEKSRGVKDNDKIRAFIHNARYAWQAAKSVG